MKFNIDLLFLEGKDKTVCIYDDDSHFKNDNKNLHSSQTCI